MTRDQLAAWLKQRDMSHTQYQRAIDQLRLSQLAAGRLLGVSNATAGRYAQGVSEIPVAVALLLRRLVDDARRVGGIPFEGG